MAATKASKAILSDAENVRTQWLSRLEELVSQVERWAKCLEWSTRRIEKKMASSRIGDYRAPALLMQKETTRVLLEPIGPSAPGADGVVDLYLMPAYDDIASLYFFDGRWNLQYVYRSRPTGASTDEGEFKPLSEETFQVVLAEMIRSAS